MRESEREEEEKDGGKNEKKNSARTGLVKYVMDHQREIDRLG